MKATKIVFDIPSAKDVAKKSEARKVELSASEEKKDLEVAFTLSKAINEQIEKSIFAGYNQASIVCNRKGSADILTKKYQEQGFSIARHPKLPDQISLIFSW